MHSIPPVELLCYAADKLGTLCQEVVFLGGAVVSLLIDEPGGLPPRITRDVDVAIKVSGLILDVYDLDQRLLSLGFRNDMQGPVCRYLHGSAVIDVIPVSPHQAGEVNLWYGLALESPDKYRLPNGLNIRVIDPVCFLGTKLTAFRSPSREHHDDIFLSRDFGDLVRVIDGRPNLGSEIAGTRNDLREFIENQFGLILSEPYLYEAIAEHVDSGREELVVNRIQTILDLQG